MRKLTPDMDRQELKETRRKALRSIEFEPIVEFVQDVLSYVMSHGGAAYEAEIHWYQSGEGGFRVSEVSLSAELDGGIGGISLLRNDVKGAEPVLHVETAIISLFERVSRGEEGYVHLDAEYRMTNGLSPDWFEEAMWRFVVSFFDADARQEKIEALDQYLRRYGKFETAEAGIDPLALGKAVLKIMFPPKGQE